jgi:hypothetical protein
VFKFYLLSLLVVSSKKFYRTGVMTVLHKSQIASLFISILAYIYGTVEKIPTLIIICAETNPVVLMLRSLKCTKESGMVLKY